MEQLYVTSNHLAHTQTNNIYSRFVAFTQRQQVNHFAWLVTAFFVQGCIVSPLTVLAIVTNSNHIGLWIPCLLAFSITEVVMLAAQPTKITIPVFFGGILLDMLVILSSFFVH